jgi:hypothetical protein
LLITEQKGLDQGRKSKKMRPESNTKASEPASQPWNFPPLLHESFWFLSLLTAHEKVRHQKNLLNTPFFTLPFSIHLTKSLPASHFRD